MNVNDFATANFLATEIYADERTRLDGELKDAFVKVITTPVAPEAAAYLAEFIYANSSKFLKSSREKAADVADFVTANGFYGFRDDERGLNIAKKLRGETVANAPTALAQFNKEAPSSISPAPTPPAPTPAAA